MTSTRGKKKKNLVIPSFYRGKQRHKIATDFLALPQTKHREEVAITRIPD